MTYRQLNVQEHFGATGDGSTDDSDAIQAAVDAMVTAGGGVLLFPAGGTYVITERIEFSSATDFAVDFRGATIKADDTFPIDTNLCMLYFTNCERFRVLGGTIDGNKAARGVDGANAATCHNVYVHGGSDGVLDSVYCKDAAEDGFYFGRSGVAEDRAYTPTNMVMQSCTADSSNRHGLVVANAHRLKVIGSEFRNSKGARQQCGINIEPNAESPDVTDWQTSYGYVVDDIVEHPENSSTFLKCRVAHTSGTSWDQSQSFYWELIAQVEGVTITGCTMADNSGNGLLIYEANRGITVTGNTFARNLSGSLRCRSEATIMGNTFSDHPRILDWGSSTPYDAGDLVRSAGDYWIRLTEGTSGSTWDATEQADWYEMSEEMPQAGLIIQGVDAKNVRVIGNTFENEPAHDLANAYAVYCDTDAPGPIIISENTFENCVQVLRTNQSVTFTNNAIYRPINTTAVLSIGGDECQIKGNRFLEGHQNLVQVVGSNNVIEGNQFVECDLSTSPQTGIVQIYSGDGNRVEKNTFDQTLGSNPVAIRVQSTADNAKLGRNEIGDCTYTGGYGDGGHYFDTGATYTFTAPLDVRDFGAVGDGSTEDTAAFQRAINLASHVGGGVVRVPAAKYIIDLTDMKSNVTLHLEPGVELQAVSGFSNNQGLIEFDDTSHATLIGYGARISMDDSTTSDAHRAGIVVRDGCSNTTIKGVKADNCGGDGLTLYGGSTDFVAEDCWFHQNRRNGASIVNADRATFTRCIFSESGRGVSGGQSPQAGADVEPVASSGECRDVVFTDCKFLDNVGVGLSANMNLLDTDLSMSITASDCLIARNYGGGVYLAEYDDSKTNDGKVLIKGCDIIDSGSAGVYIEEWCDDGPLIEIKDCRLQNPNIINSTTDQLRAHVNVSRDGAGETYDIGNVIVSGCEFRDERELTDTATFTYTSGDDGTGSAPQVGDTVTDDSTSATGTIANITLSGGAWADGDAAGTVWLRKQSGAFVAANSCTFSGGETATVGTVTAARIARRGVYGIIVGGSGNVYNVDAIDCRYYWAESSYAVPARLIVNGTSSNIRCNLAYSGTPESALTAAVGSTYRRTDTGEFYLKISGSGSTGWTLTSTPAYASIYVKDGSSAQTVTASTQTKMTGFATDGEELNCTADVTNDRIEIDVDGDYLVSLQCSFTGSANSTVEAFVFNGSTPAESHIGFKRALNASGDVGSASCGGILALSDGDYVEVHIESTHTSVTPVHAQLTVRKLN